MSEKFFDVNKDSLVKFDEDFGDKFTLDEFIECCESGGFIDYDGYASEIILNGFVIYDDSFYPSDALENKHELIELQKELGQLEIIWYNR